MPQLRRLLLLLLLATTASAAPRSFAIEPAGPGAAAGSSTAQDDLSYGGRHEWGLWEGFSGFTGPVWGYSRDVKYGSVDLRYSYRWKQGRDWSLRWAPELTALAVMRETRKTDVNPNAPATHVGAGLSPVSFQVVARPHARVQPFFSEAAGFVYYGDRVLSPQGSQFMFTIDFGGGVNLFTTQRNALTLGYRYQHTSNANISVHNPGTDANILYVGFSHFRTRRAW